MTTSTKPSTPGAHLEHRFAREFEEHYLSEFLIKSELPIMDALIEVIKDGTCPADTTMASLDFGAPWMERTLSAIEMMHRKQSAQWKIGVAARVAITLRKAMSPEQWFGFMSSPCDRLRKANPEFLLMYVKALIGSAMASEHPTIMIDLLGLSIPTPDLLYYSGPYPEAMLEYISDNPDVAIIFSSGAPSKELAKLAIKHGISGLGPLLDPEDRGAVFTNELGV